MTPRLFTRFSLKSILVFSLLCTGLVPLLCFIGINLPSVGDKVEQLTALERVNELEEQVAVLEKTIEHRKADLRTITALPGVAELFSEPEARLLDPKKIRQRLTFMFQRWLPFESGVKGILMVDARGAVVSNWHINDDKVLSLWPVNQKVPEALLVKTWLDESKAYPLERVFVADVEQEFFDKTKKHTHFPRIILGIPGKNKEGRFGGAVFMQVSLASFVESLPYDFIVTGGGRVLHRYEKEHGHGSSNAHVHRYDKLGAEYAGLVDIDPAKPHMVVPGPERKKVAFVKIVDDPHREHTVWLANTLQTGEFEGWLHKILLRFAVILIGLFVLVLVLAMAFADRADKMRRQLVSGLTELVDKKKPLQLEWTWPSDVQELGAELETLAQALIDSQQSLQQNERFLRSIFNGIQDGISVHDRDYTILQTNECVEKWYHDKMPLVGKKCYEVYYSRQEPCEACPSREAMSQGVLQRYELPGQMVGGVKRWMEIFAYPIRDESGQVVQVVEFIRDITAKKEAEFERDSLADQLAFSQKMEAVGTLAGGVAHDFNNILSAINGYAEMCLMKMADDEPLRPKIETILESGQRASRLTQQLLAFSRKQIVHPQDINVELSLQGIKKMLGRILGEDIDIAMAVSPNLWHVRADQTQFEQVIINLAVNARDAMPQGGQLTFEAKNVSLDQAYGETHYKIEPGEYVLLAISDSGQGMDRPTLDKIFEPFFTTKGEGKGTGLGLATVYGIIKQNDGHVLVYSEPGQGTTFKIYLPRLVQTAPSQQALPEVEEMATGTETILLVEDDEVVRTMAVEILTSLGYLVLEAADGQEALQTCRRYHGRIELLLTDVVMPKMNGAELAKKVSKLRPEIKVLFMSGYTDDAVVRHGILREDVEFLQKPVSPKALATALRTVMDGEEAG